MAANNNKNIVSTWLVWEFYEMPKFLFQVWNNYFLFAVNFFSAPVLLRTIFSPWRRYNWRYPSIVNVGEFLSTFISNIFSRFLGALLRIILILIGIIFQVFVAIAGLFIFLGWFLAPFIAITGLLAVFTF